MSLFLVLLCEEFKVYKIFIKVICVCVCVYLQVAVVALAAAVELLGDVLSHVEVRADVTEEPPFRNHKLQTCT